MLSTFADVFGSVENDTKKLNNAQNPFDLSTSTMADPFGITSNMKLSASSQKFDDSPFIIESTNNDQSNQICNENEASLSSNRNSYQNSTTNISSSDLTSTFDPLGDTQNQTTHLSIKNNVTHSTSINLINPFSIPTIANELSTLPTQTSPVDLLFDLEVDPSTLTEVKLDSSLVHSAQVISSYDLIGLNKTTDSSSSSLVKVLKSDSLTDLPKVNQTNKSSSSSLMTKSNISMASSYHSLPMNAPVTSPSTLRVQATALTLMTGTTSSTSYDDQFLDWLTDSDDLMCSIDPKLSGPSEKIDINMLKSTEDLLGSISKQPPLTIVKELCQESSSIDISQSSIRRSSNDEVPSICISEPTSDHNDSNIVPQGYFDDKQEDDNDSKIVFKIREKQTNTSHHDTIMPVPLLPPPFSPSISKKNKEITDDTDSSSTIDNEDENDPLAIFRSKVEPNENYGNNLITDWEDDEHVRKMNEEDKRVCSMYLCVYLLLCCLCYHQSSYFVHHYIYLYFVH